MLWQDVERHVDSGTSSIRGQLVWQRMESAKRAMCYWRRQGNRWEATFRRVERAFLDTGKLEWTDVINGFLMFEQLKHAQPYINTFLAWQVTHHPNMLPTWELIETFLNLLDLWECFLPSYQVNRELMGEK